MVWQRFTNISTLASPMRPAPRSSLLVGNNHNSALDNYIVAPMNIHSHLLLRRKGASVARLSYSVAMVTMLQLIAIGIVEAGDGVIRLVFVP